MNIFVSIGLRCSATLNIRQLFILFPSRYKNVFTLVKYSTLLSRQLMSLPVGSYLDGGLDRLGPGGGVVELVGE